MEVQSDLFLPHSALSFLRAGGFFKVLGLNHSFTGDTLCASDHPVLLEAGRRAEGSDVHFVGLLYNDSPESGRAWIQEMGGQSYPSVIDPSGRTAIAYGVYGVPETYFIGRDGRVAHKHTGPVTAAALTEWIGRIRAPSAPVQEMPPVEVHP